MIVELGLIDRLTQQLKDTGTKHDVARDMAISILRDRGHVYANTEELTPEGKKRDRLGAEGRALDRASKSTGRPTRDFQYDRRTNRATIKKK